MSRHSSGRGVGHNRPYEPRVEELEVGKVPTVNFSVEGSTLFIAPARSPSSLTLTGTRIRILDNGSNGINNVIALSSNRPYVPNVAISDIVVLGSRQDDRIQYTLTGDLQGLRALFASLGAGDDRFDAFLRRNLLANATLQIGAVGGSGDDRITSTTVAQLGQNSVLDIYLNGGSGDDAVRSLTTSFVGISNGAYFNASVFGGQGADNLQATYQGSLNGTATVYVDAGGGNDRATVTYNLTRGSTGTLPPALLLGGGGNDDLAMLITNLGTGLSVNNMIDGGAGFDTCTRTTNVLGFSCDEDTVI